jgi:hypothetical protein
MPLPTHEAHEERHVKRFLLVALILGFTSLPALAANKSDNISIPEKFSVAGKEMPAGEYKVSWTASGSTVTVSLEQKGAFKPITASAEATQVDAKNPYSSYELDKSGGTPVLKTLLFKKFNLVFQTGTAKAP